jgi:hypothetical protein
MERRRVCTRCGIFGFYTNQLDREEQRCKWDRKSNNGDDEAYEPGQGPKPFAIEDIAHRFIVIFLNV